MALGNALVCLIDLATISNAHITGDVGERLLEEKVKWDRTCAVHIAFRIGRRGTQRDTAVFLYMFPFRSMCLDTLLALVIIGVQEHLQPVENTIHLLPSFGMCRVVGLCGQVETRHTHWRRDQ